MKQDVALGEIMADRWRDFVVESYQLGGLGLGCPGRGEVDCLLLALIMVSHGDTCREYFKHSSAGIMLEFVIIDLALMRTLGALCDMTLNFYDTAEDRSKVQRPGKP